MPAYFRTGLVSGLFLSGLDKFSNLSGNAKSESFGLACVLAKSRKFIKWQAKEFRPGIPADVIG